ncbi:heterokaryon incompatibility protein-domain-containing protein [Hypoxylon rubiginosum]|uniref:Heterokaryon incompatibility protein-domain-containing protein n=1 Tax=Hypoxylon rubiginosum TaxID=110542 RepID=A0ACC0CUZ4_9PEZI|nr:heterokaryon incompatibility protein-domain-containing protein [Hypoxylon rubiginosum]
MADIYRYVLPTDGRCIRVFTIRPGVEQDEIHIELQKDPVSLDNEEHVPYEALSYVWGSESDRAPVRFGASGQFSLSLTRNLAEALRFLRYPNRPRTMWADAICINQENGAEKSAQVSIMGDIFREATHVVAWLGLETDTTRRAVELFEEMGSQVEIVNWETGARRPSATARNEALCDSTSALPYTALDGQAIMGVLERPWFRRLWVRQEIQLARAASLLIGTFSIPWIYLQTGVFCIYYRASHFTPFDEVTRTATFDFATSVCKPSDIHLHLLRNSLRGTQCRDPRDRIYSVLSLLRDQPWLDITPDYGAPAAEVYRDIALKYISTVKRVALLESCQLTEPASALPGLCSWVPDWSVDQSSQPVFGPTSLGTMLFSDVTYQGDGVLRVAGVEHSSVLHCQEIDEEIVLAGLNSLHEFLSKISPSKDMENVPYVSGGSLLDAVSNTLYRPGFRHHSPPSLTHVPSYDGVKRHVGAFLATGPLGSGDAIPHIIQWVWRRLRGVRLFTTPDGYFGLASKWIRAKDQIVLFPGAQHPTVLRRWEDSSRFKVVGSCYLHGVMQGEPFLGPLPVGVRQVLGSEDEAGHLRYENSSTGEVTLEDPRFRMRGIDVAPYEDRWKRGEWAKVEASLLKEIDVKLVDFFLI